MHFFKKKPNQSKTKPKKIFKDTSETVKDSEESEKMPVNLVFKGVGSRLYEEYSNLNNRRQQGRHTARKHTELWPTSLAFTELQVRLK